MECEPEHPPLVAVNDAMGSGDWEKAAELLQQYCKESPNPNNESVKGFYKEIASHYEEQHQTSDAEKYYIRAGAVGDAVDMYRRHGMSDDMHRLAKGLVYDEDMEKLMMEQAKQCEAKSDYAAAERIYIKINKPDDCIVMYKKARDFNNMIRVVSTYRPELLSTCHSRLGTLLMNEEGNLALAEEHFIQGGCPQKAVVMYMDHDLWEDAVRVVNEYPHSSIDTRKLLITRILAMDAEEGLDKLRTYSMVESGIEAALESQKFDVAIQWASLPCPPSSNSAS